MPGTLSPRTRRNLVRILPFGLIWLLLSQIFLISDYAAVDDPSNVPDSAIQLDPGIFIFASLAVAVFGCLVGLFEVVYLSDRFAKNTLAEKLIYKTLFYAAIMFAIIVVTFPVAAAMELDTHLLDERVWDKLLTFLVSKTHLSTAVQLSASLGASLFYSEISEHMGPGVLINFLTGKYHTPKEEVRIFMFADMKSSTQIAEELGHIRYFELLQAYYADLSDGIIDHAGEIYQYVGDEVVVSWPVDLGLQDRNCIQCFYAMKEALRRKGDWYRRHFGMVPDFKAGFHMGAVTTGEIGVLKKEIIFTGDVLNATSRIQALCAVYDVDMLISGALLQHLDAEPSFEVASLGRRKLRGKEQEVELFAPA